MISSLHCTHMLFLAHECPTRSSRVELAEKMVAATPQVGRGEQPRRPVKSWSSTTRLKEDSVCGNQATLSTTVPHPDYVPDKEELERRRLGEAQPQLVPKEVFVNKFRVAQAGTGRESLELSELAGGQVVMLRGYYY
ncbi:hypothetical protein G6O67_005064 [Ophiocordyceps sinensis]|uniref:Uncharacterized protein n=1 Tax=Ophiocordyceps sinensis TaxID=72228 RepID=A0A8H4PQT2_9HYPO|nr:hypothetical protein G6O67_005064 [Ophiocordyceps sinensis]